MDNVDKPMNVRPPRTDLNQGPQPGGVSETGKSNPSAGAVAATGSGSDTVTFTNKAAEMLRLEESLARIPDSDNTRVTVIQAAIADGSYHIDPEKIVDSLLSMEKDIR